VLASLRAMLFHSHAALVNVGQTTKVQNIIVSFGLRSPADIEKKNSQSQRGLERKNLLFERKSENLHAHTRINHSRITNWEQAEWAAFKGCGREWKEIET
jgi:hypothetical protein